MIDNYALLIAVKTDLGITTDVYDTRLQSCICTARQRIREEGIVLTDCESDFNLVVMFAAYLWRCRSSGEGLPRMLRYAMNNRLFSQRARL